MSFLPDNLPPLPPSPPPSSSSSSAVAAMSNNYLSSIPTPPLPSTISSNLMIPSNTMNMSSAAAYQQYYQQYMYSMYSSMYGSVPPPLPQQTTTTTPNFNYKQPTLVNATTTSNSQITNNNSGTKEPTIVNTNQQQTKQAIKFNLKFQNNLAENGVNTKKSRFNNNNNSNSLANIAAEQEQFKKQQQIEATPLPPPPKQLEEEEEQTVSTTTSSSSSATADIVADINKWPATLKAYCTKVYQFYSKQTAVSEDQVTKYLQQRITDTFKLKPDLNIDWDNEKIPDLSDIKQVAPLSQLQIQQQKRQQKMHEAALAMAKAKAAEILAQKQKLKQQLETTSLAAEISKNKRKYEHDHESRSGSKSSTSSSESSSENNKDFISLTTTTTTNNKKVKKAVNSMQKIEKKKLKNIQINNMNGKKVFKNLVSNSNKRKSSDETSDGEDDDEDDDEEEEEENAENQKQQKLLTTPNKFLSKKQKKLKANLINRQKRFQNGGKNQQQQVNNRFTRTLFSSNSYKETSGDTDLNEVCIGLNQDLEKEYLRLTGPPEPVMIRPLAVLKKSLVHVLEKYSRTNDYRYICDQMKAIRQDLTVQMIQNEFTVEVYETHARIAIKNKDRDEFNQCQSQLKNLYILLEKNASLTSEQESKSIEFIGYRLVYNMLTKSHTDLNQVIKEIKLKYSSHSYLNHLLALRNAWHLNNYVKFFRLYKQCNEMSKCLIDLFIERERKLALKYIIKAYRPAIKLECVKEMLAYETIQKCKDDLISYKLTLQSVPLVIEGNKNLSNSKSSTSSSSKQLFEDILDCKSCNIQF